MSAHVWSGASRAQRTAVLVALAAAAVVRSVQLALKWDQPLLLNDSVWYSGQAVVLAAGRGFADPIYGGPSAEHGPLTPLVLAAVSWVDSPVPWQRAVMTVVGVLTVLGIVVLARRVAGWPAAVAAAWIAALYPNLWINDGLVMSESPAALLVVAVMWLALGVAQGRSDRWRTAGCGLAIGFAALARSELVLLLPILLLVVWRRRHASGHSSAAALALMVAGAAVPLLPWVGANLVRFERPALLTTNDGTTLRGANCDETYAGPAVGGWSLFCVVAEPWPPGEDPAVRSDRQRGQAVRYAADHVERVPIVVAARLGRLVDVVGVRNMVHGDVGEERNRWAAWAGVVSFWLLAVLTVMGLVRLDPTARWVLLAPVLSVVITAFVFYGGHRIRAPAEPTIAVAAGVAVAELVRRRAVRA